MYATDRSAKGDVVEHAGSQGKTEHRELWDALGGGDGLRALLVRFYDRVYEDERLSPFFHATTKEWAIDHQFAFLRQIMTGEDVFFGDRPRNAHHWMVISDELFDYRERLFQEELRRVGLPADRIHEFQAIHERFRKQIVKTCPFPKKRRGVALPLDGWESIALSAGGICDSCATILEKEASAFYHVRTGKVACDACHSASSDPLPTSEKV